MYLAALAGCQYIAPYVNRMQVAGIDPYEEIHLARIFIDQKDLTAQIMGASFKNTRQKNRIRRELILRQLPLTC